MSPAMVQRVRQAHPQIRVVNLYGPTEDTVYSSIHEITDADLEGAPFRSARPSRMANAWWSTTS
ncbi:MAG: hypothetical protein R3D63_09460 [Paracoccaceae bacterium]